MQYTVIRLY